MPWDDGKGLAAGETFFVKGKSGKRVPVAEARAASAVVVDLGDEWVPFIFSESDPGGEVKPNGYRETFVKLANNRANPNEIFLESPEGRAAVLRAAGVPVPKKGLSDAELPPEGKKALGAARRALQTDRGRNFLEVYGIPPTLSVLLARLEEDAGRGDCYAGVDRDGLSAFTQEEEISYQNRDQARKEHAEAVADAAWVSERLTGAPREEAANDAGAPVTVAALQADPRTRPRVERWHRGQMRLRAVKALQARLTCEGLLSPKAKYTEGMFDLATHEALAEWERKNDIFGWGFLGGETLLALLRAPDELHLGTFRRILAERVADAAGVVEDGSVSKGKRPAMYKDASGAAKPVPDLVGQHVDALMAALQVETAADMAALLRKLGPQRLANLSVAIPAPPLPEYYAGRMDLSVEIDRGDVWYDFPFDPSGKAIEQKRERFPSLTLFVRWQSQKIPLVRWRTTIGSWRSEMGADGKIYYRYKNSDVGPRIWKNVVAGPVWIPPDSTPGKDLLTRKVFDRGVGPVTVVNTDVMGPGFQSAYGLVMAIHLKPLSSGGVFDNQIRTHGSVDYTSIARRFSHGCHRLVNNRAVRLFSFILKRRAYKRQGNMALAGYRKRIPAEAGGKDHTFQLTTRGYYYELVPPVPVLVHEGRVMGSVKKPIASFVRKPGVDYGPETETPEESEEPSAEGADAAQGVAGVEPPVAAPSVGP